MKKLTLLIILVISLLSCKAQSVPESIDTLPPTVSQPASAPAASASPEQIIKDVPLTIAEAEDLAGFDVREPTYLPKGVAFEYATYEQPGFPGVNLQFRLTHEKYGDMGYFFFISQEQKPEAPPDAVSCGENTDGCEILQVGDMTVVYRAYSQPDGHVATEGFAWYGDGFFFRLHRMAGEPGKIYKDELLKVVESIQ